MDGGKNDEWHFDYDGGVGVQKVVIFQETERVRAYI